MTPHCSSYAAMEVLAIRTPRGTWNVAALERTVIAQTIFDPYLKSKLTNRSRVTSDATGIVLYIVIAC